MGVAMKRLVYCLMILLFALTGCSSLPITKKSPACKFGKTYNIGLVQEASVGMPMITIYTKFSLPSYRIREAYQPRELPTITTDEEWVAHHILGDNYIITAKKWPYRFLGVEIRPSGELAREKPWVQVYNYKRTMQDSWQPSNPQVFLPTDGHVLHDGYFKAEFIYAGTSSNSIHISYEEFTNDMTKPAHRQDFHYDLSKSDQFTFRSLRIEVMEADNRRIKFKVLDDGGLPWVPGC
jgi:hypothetical protein